MPASPDMRRSQVFVAIGLTLLVAASSGAASAQTPDAAGATSPPAATRADAAPPIVIARDFMFAPRTLVSDAGLFRSGALDTNESFTFQFAKPGTYHYACSIHPRMVGTIVVE